MKMKAAVMHGANDIRYEDTKKPLCPKDGFILKVKAIGLCGSDIRSLTTDSRKGNYPHIYGHEQVGIIDEIGSEINDFKIGERVYIYPYTPCTKCDNCRSGHTENCLKPIDYTNRQGGFADYFEVTKDQILAGNVYRIPDNIDFELATLSEPLSSVYACQDNIDVKLGDTVVVIGAGPIGCFHAQLAKLRGAFKVIMIDINDARLEKSKNYSVDYIINSTKEDPIEAVKKLTDNLGADKVISANPSTEAQSQSIYMVKKGGIGVFFGGVAKGKLTEIDTNYVHYNNIWLYGHFASSSMQCRKAFELAISPTFPARKFITHVLPLSQINEAIKLTQSGEAIKVILIP